MRLDGFANIEHIDSLKNWFLPRVEKFSKKIDDFEASNASVRECVVRLDEDISLKASKVELKKQ